MVITHIKDWLAKPETVFFLIFQTMAFIAYLPTLKQKFADSKENNLFKKIVNVSIEVSKEYVESNLKNEDKLKSVVNFVYNNILTEKEKEKVSLEQVQNGVVYAYHNYVKGKE